MVAVKKVLLLGAIVLLAMTIFSGCLESTPTGSDESKFVGTWTSVEGNTGTYSADGTYVYRYAKGTTFTGVWHISSCCGQLVISYPAEGYTYTFDYYFENNDNSLYKMLVGEDHYDVWTKTA